MTDIPDDDSAGNGGRHTPGPWRWEVNLSSQQVELCGTAGRMPFDNTVMSFKRWGTQNAAPVFWFWNKPHVSDEPQRADALALPVAGREHHQRWFRTIDHPDARLIAAAPELLAALETAVARLETCARASGSDAEFVESMLAPYRASIAKARGHD